eukprot:1157754-Pelagomonas_calceolata.AAC.9
MQERPRTDGLKAAGQRGLQRRIHKTQCVCVSETHAPTPPRADTDNVLVLSAIHSSLHVLLNPSGGYLQNQKQPTC